jgi:hypothetical protein
MDFEEMRGAYLRATQDDTVAQLTAEIERLRLENRELRSEVQRLTVAAY